MSSSTPANDTSHAKPDVIARITEAMEEIEAGQAEAERGRRRIAKGFAILRGITHPATLRKKAASLYRVDPAAQFTEDEIEAARLRHGLR